jgi:hypothetical protein
MAERRMFSKQIIDSDAFLDLPLSTQALYFHLSMRADDDGFVNNPKKIRRLVGASEDDLNLLIAKSFLIKFETGLVVIKHWKIHNYIQKDRYRPSAYIEEKEMLKIKENKAYSLDVSAMDTECIQDVRVGKVRIGKDRLGKDSINNNVSSAKRNELISLFEDLYKRYHKLHPSSNGKSKARDKYILWCTKGVKGVKLTPEQIEDAVSGYVQEHIDKEDKGEWTPPYKNIDTLMKNITDYIKGDEDDNG